METEKRSKASSLLVTFGVIVVMLTPLVVYVLLRAHDEGPGMRSDPGTTEQVESGAQPRKHVIPEVEAAVPKVRAATKPSPVASSPAPKAPTLASKKFPSAGSVPVGMERVKLIEAFGRPNMVTTEVNEGRSVETFHYLKPETGTETVVLLRSGRVVEATSSAY
jgi:hypothetical protein